MKKEIVFIDMDNVLVDFQSGLNKISDEVKTKFKDNPDDIPGIFSLMEPLHGAHDAIDELNKRYDLYILSTAPWDNPSAWSDKLEWVKKYFDDIKRIDEKGEEVGVFHKRLILSHRKDLCCKDGAFLIDDRPKHGTKDFGNHWLSFGKEGKYKDWEEVADYLMHRLENYDNIESFCEHHGFVFHSHGHGKWGAYPFYTFEKIGEDSTILYSIEYTPFNNEIKIGNHLGTFKGNLKSIDELRFLVESMQIDFSSIENKEESHKTAELKMKRKLFIANKIATTIQIKYHFRNEKCFHMALQGEWWTTANHLSQLSNRVVDSFTQQVLDDIENNKIE